MSERFRLVMEGGLSGQPTICNRKCNWYLKMFYKCPGLLYFLGHITHTTYIDMAYHYQPSSVVCRSVGRSVDLSH